MGNQTRGNRPAVSRRSALAGASALAGLAGGSALGLLAAACGGPGGAQTDAVPSGKLAPAKIRYLHNDRHRDDAYARVFFNTLLSSKQQPVLPATTAVTEANGRSTPR